MVSCSQKGWGEKFDNKLLCDGKRDCEGWIYSHKAIGGRKDFNHDENPLICTHRKHCMTVDGFRNIPQSKVCDGFINCLDKSDENPEVCTKKGRIYCSALKGARVWALCFQTSNVAIRVSRYFHQGWATYIAV